MNSETVGNRFNVAMAASPQPGQWWFQTDKQHRSDAKCFRVFFCGRDSLNRLIFQGSAEDAEIDNGVDWANWHHDPACTGWDWTPEVKPEQKWPQWYIPTRTEVSEILNKPIAFYRRDGEHSGETFHTDGSSFKWGSWEHLTDVRVCSEREALDRILPQKLIPADVVNELAVSIRKETKAEVVESPDDWVTQDRVPARKGVDEYRYIWRSGKASNWESYDWLDVKHHVHGYTDDVGDRMEVRCRREDLPVVEAKTPLPCSYCSKPEFKGWNKGKCPYCGAVKATTASVTVYEVVYGDDLTAMHHRMVADEDQLASIRSNWKYVSVVSTKTVEVMLNNASCNGPQRE